MKRKLYIRRLFFILLSILGINSLSAAIGISGYTPVGSENGFPLFQLNPGKIIVYGTTFCEILIDDIIIAGYSWDDWPTYYRAYTIDISSYCDGNIHKLKLFDHGSDCGECYFYSSINLMGEFPDGIIYSVENDIATVTGCFTNIKEANISSSFVHEGISYPVKSISTLAFSGKRNLEYINIPESITTIKDSVFYNCINIKTLVIGSNVNKIGKTQQHSCGSEKNFYPRIENIKWDEFIIPKIIWMCNTPPVGISNLKAYQNYVSNDKFKLSNQKIYPFLSSIFEVDNVVYVPVSPSDRTCDVIDCNYTPSSQEFKIDTIVKNKGIDLKVLDINDFAFFKNVSMTSMSISNSGNIGEYAFTECSQLNSITIGSSIETIGGWAFSGNTSLQEINIPNNITEIGVYAFFGDTELNNVILGEGISSLPARVFNNCSSLPSLVIPANINEIGDYAFYGCSSLSHVTIEENQDKSKLTTLKLGSNGNKALFNDCPLDEVFIGRQLSYQTGSSYGYSPFYRNTSLRTVEITDAETQIYDNEFYGCSNLSSLTIGNGVKSIGDWAFSGCSSLQFFSAGYDVETIGEEAFSDCTALTEYYSYSIIPPVCGNQALDDINKWNCILYVPAASADEYQVASQWKDFFFINEMEAVAVTDIILNVESVELQSGDTFQLEATIEPGNASDQTIVWISSNPAVATVSENGFVSALSAGTTLITATCGDVSVTCAVTVLDDSGVENIFSANDTTISVYSIDGRLVRKDCKAEELKMLSKGIYIIVSGKERYKISI